MRCAIFLLFLLLTAFVLCACVRRTILVTSEPDGALVYLNDQEVGRTPVEVDFIYYGEYDVRLVRDGYEPIVTSAMAWPPLWDNIPLDLVAEAIPGEPHAQVHWHYDLQPPDANRDEMIARAIGMRERIALPAGEKEETETRRAAGDRSEEETEQEVMRAAADRDDEGTRAPVEAGPIDVFDVWQRTHDRFREVGYEGLSIHEQVFLNVWSLEHQVSTGGFRQYLYNSTGDQAFDLVSSLESVGAQETAQTAREALNVMSPGGPVPRNREARREIMAAWGEDGPEYARLIELDRAFYESPDNLRALLTDYVQSNRSAFRDQ